METIQYTFLSSNAKDPIRCDSLDAGIDLKSAHDCLIPARGRALIKTGLQFQIPEGYFGKIESRSGLCWKYGIETGAGVIDESYRGEIMVVLHNHTDEIFNIKAGDRIAQMILLKYGKHIPIKCEPEEISTTKRGEKGFGSTGII